MLIERTRRRLAELAHEVWATAEDLRGELGTAAGLQGAVRELTQTLARVVSQAGDTLAHLGGEEQAREGWSYLGKHLRPLFLRSRCMSRAYHRPCGYPGDYYLLSLLYQGRPWGQGLSLLLDATFLEAATSQAVRHRQLFLPEALASLARQVRPRETPLRLLDLGCGPCQELDDFLPHWEGPLEVFCVDHDVRALRFAANRLGTNEAVSFLRQDVLRLSRGHFPPIHLAYCVGLVDYLPDRLAWLFFNRVYDLLEEGGLFLIGNLDRTCQPVQDRFAMDHILEWQLTYRTPAEVQTLFATSRFGRCRELQSDMSHIQLYALGQKGISR